MSTSNLAVKLTASYISDNNLYDYKRIIVNDPELTLFDSFRCKTGSKPLDEGLARIASIKFVGHISSYGFDLAENITLNEVIRSVQSVIMREGAKTSDLCKVVQWAWEFVSVNEALSQPSG